jgi:hypothetical protein
MQAEDRYADVLARFGAEKTAKTLPELTAEVGGGPLGGYLGYLIGSRYNKPQLGAMLGGITGGVSGKLISEALAEPPAPPMPQPMPLPMGAPFAIDPTSPDIPEWALRGSAALKYASTDEHGSVRDVILGDILGPLHPIIEGIRNKDLGGALRGLAGQSLGVAGGGLLGYGAGKALGHLGINPHVLGVPLDTILAGLGATIGGVHGLNYARQGKF